MPWGTVVTLRPCALKFPMVSHSLDGHSWKQSYIWRCCVGKMKVTGAVYEMMVCTVFSTISVTKFIFTNLTLIIELNWTLYSILWVGATEGSGCGLHSAVKCRLASLSPRLSPITACLVKIWVSSHKCSDIMYKNLTYHAFSVTAVCSFAAITWFEMQLSEFGSLILYNFASTLARTQLLPENVVLHQVNF